jgi:hypothetical protein
VYLSQTILALTLQVVVAVVAALVDSVDNGLAAVAVLVAVQAVVVPKNPVL